MRKRRMKTGALCILLLVFLVSPDMRGEEGAISLMSGWKVARALDKDKLVGSFFGVDFDDSAWAAVDVLPGKAPFREKYIFYRKRVGVPAEWEGKDVGLFFDGVDDTATVYVNGRKVAEHRGWDVPFDIDISRFLRFGEENVIAVFCENTWGSGGIWQPVSIKLSAALTKDRRDAEESLLAELRALRYKIVFETDRDGNWELYLMNADGSDPVNLTRTADLDEMYPHCSPDGKRICFVADEWRSTPRGKKKFRDVYYMNVDGSDRKRVAEDGRQPCWSPDSTKIAFSMAESRDYTTRDYATRGIFIYDLNTGQTTQLPNENIEHLYNTAWSPDGKWFVFTVHKAMGFGHAILAMDSKGERVYPLKAPGCRPDWSPDGRKLTWVLDDQTVQAADFNEKGCAKGAPMPVPLPNSYTVVKSNTKSRKAYHPDWSPDGKYIAFSYGSGSEQVGETGAWDICVVRAGGGPWVSLTSNQGANKEPDWCAPAE